MYTQSTWDWKLGEDAKGRMIVNPQRFPREVSAALVAEIKLEFPYPAYNPRTDGSHNPGEYVLTDIAKQDVGSLKERCTKHGLSDEGEKADLVRRLWRHWRSGRLEIGFPFWGYGPGYERVVTPSCSCGRLRGMKTITRFPRIPKMKGANGMDVIRFPRPIRFPRTNEPTRFPRLAPDDPRKNDPIWMLRPEKKND